MDAVSPENTRPVSDDWFADAFGELYPIVYAHRTVEAAVPEARFAAQALDLAPSDRVLDLCCGAGRHLATLEQYGASLTGLDYSPQLLSLARNRLASTTQLIRADMRVLPLCCAFDVLFSFFTSFGYFLDEADNAAAAAEMGRVLKPGGRFFMDYLNPRAVTRTLTPQSRRESQGYVIEERRWIDSEAQRVNKSIAISRNQRQLGVITESVRMYELEELKALLASAGVHVTHVYGNYSGEDYGAASDRMILVGVKGAV